VREQPGPAEGYREIIKLKNKLQFPPQQAVTDCFVKCRTIREPVPGDLASPLSADARRGPRVTCKRTVSRAPHDAKTRPVLSRARGRRTTNLGILGRGHLAIEAGGASVVVVTDTQTAVTPRSYHHSPRPAAAARPTLAMAPRPSSRSLPLPSFSHATTSSTTSTRGCRRARDDADMPRQGACATPPSRGVIMATAAVVYRRCAVVHARRTDVG